MRKIITIIMILNVLVGYGQSNNDSIENLVSKNVDILIKEEREKDTKSFGITNNNHRKVIIKPILDYLHISYRMYKKYENDSNKNVLDEVLVSYDWFKRISDSTEFRRVLTYDLLVLYQRDRDKFNNGGYFNIPEALSDPGDSKVSDFNAGSRKILSELLQDSLHNKRVIKLIGVAGMQDQIPELKQFLPNGSQYRKHKHDYFWSWEWTARLSMARLGDKEQIEYCVKKIEDSKPEIMSNSHAAGDYFDDLAFIKKPEILPFLFDMLLSNQPFEYSVSTSSYFALNRLTKLLKDFPPEVGFSLTEKGVKFYKKWVRKHKGKYEFKD